ncbi:hypothetical protein IFR05_012968 [Cadophora sp. M221]|nr:hypothetical protein IFR05_012968 [Cadophora sp. M221]
MARIRAYFGKQKRKAVPQRIASRLPVPLSPGRPSIAQLPDEVVLLILSFMESVELSTIASLSSSLHEKVLRTQHHLVTINLDQPRQSQGRLDILGRNLLLRAVRVLKVTGGDNNTPEVENEIDDILSRMAELMSGMTGLCDLHWQCQVPIPRVFIDCIPARTRLHASVVAKRQRDQDHDRARKLLASLVDNTSLFTLSVDIAYEDEIACGLTMRELKRVLLSCPRLARIPKMFVGPPLKPPHGWGDGPRPGAPYCGLGFSNGEKPPALEELGAEPFSHYPWGREYTPNLGLRANTIYCIDYPEKGTEEQYWARTFDWTRLRRLNDIPPCLALKIAPKLVNLKEVEFKAQYWDKATFLETLPTTLESLSIPSWGNVSSNLSCIILHGATLKKLTIHRVESHHNVAAFVPDVALLALCDGLPHLTDLGLDVARDTENNDWHYTTLDTIAKFPNLRNIHLWLDLGVAGEAPRIPHLTVSAARSLFNFLHERNRDIRYLELSSGVPGLWNMFFNGPRWESKNSVHFVCKISICEGDAADGFVTVTCPEMSAAMNKELTRLSKASEKGDEKLRSGFSWSAAELPLGIALNGPLTKDEWHTWGELQDTRAREAHRKQNSVPGKMKRLFSSSLKWAK